MLKVACGLFFSKIASHERRQIVNDHVIDDSIIVEGLFSKRWYPNCSLYMRAATGRLMQGANAVAVAPATAIYENEKRYVGIKVSMIGLEFAVVSIREG